MHITWWFLLILAIFSATFIAVWPLIPVSISSKINVSISSSVARIDLIASIILDNSPPDATFTNGLTDSPGLVEIINSTLSNPFSPMLSFLVIWISNSTAIKLRSTNACFTRTSSSFAAFFLCSDNFVQRLFNVPSNSEIWFLTLSISSVILLSFSRYSSFSSLYLRISSILLPYFNFKWLITSSLSSTSLTYSGLKSIPLL